MKSETPPRLTVADLKPKDDGTKIKQVTLKQEKKKRRGQFWALGQKKTTDFVLLNDAGKLYLLFKGKESYQRLVAMYAGLPEALPDVVAEKVYVAKKAEDGKFALLPEEQITEEYFSLGDELHAGRKGLTFEKRAKELFLKPLPQSW